MSLPYLLNTGWMLTCRNERRSFRTATHHVSKAQQKVLRKIVEANRNCEFGRQHHFEGICTAAQFRRHVPIANYASFQPSVTRIGNGQDRVLTAEPVDVLEPTSGSTTGRHLIPYTKSLRNQFQRAISCWLADLFSWRPQIRRGRAYWSISPAFGHAEYSPGGIKIGFDDDADYLSRLQRLVARHTMAVPARQITNAPPDDFRYRTLLYLLAADDLSLISVWSPTFLTALLRPLEDWSKCLAGDLPMVATHRRVQQVTSILRSRVGLPEKLAALWPQLALISCWADAAAASFLTDVKQLFPKIEIQPKGLVSTEACVSFPMIEYGGNVLAIRSHFFEFQPDADGTTTPLLAGELALGERYQVIVTTGGGLYRYQLHDVVEVVGFANECPLIRFVGRANQTSDQVGEKLSEIFVRNAIDRVMHRLALAPVFAMLVPAPSASAGYSLLLQCTGTAAGNDPWKLVAAELEGELSENPYYEHAVRMGQLSPVDVRVCESHKLDLWNEFERMCLRGGMKHGDIKPVALCAKFQWTDQLRESCTPCASSLAPHA